MGETPTPPEKKSFLPLFIIGCLLGIIFVLILIIFMIFSSRTLFPPKISEPQLPPAPITLPEETEPKEELKVESEQGETKREIAYLEANNIWLMAEDGKNKRQLTLDGSEEISYRALAFKDRDNLGYVRCPDLNRCHQIYTYNLKTGVMKLEQKVSEEEFTSIHTFAWSEAGSKLAYLYYDPKENLNLVYLKEGATLRKIKEIEIALGGRGGSFEDAQYLKFSPDGNKLLLVHTFNLPMEDQPSIFVFETASGEEIFSQGTTEDGWSTQAFFIDNHHLGYKNGSKLVKRNFETAAETVLFTAPNNLNPNLSPDGNFIAFWTYTDEESADLYLFDPASGYFKLGEDMANPQWLAKETLVVFKTTSCIDCMFNYQIEGLIRFNRIQKTKTSLLDSKTVSTFVVSP